MFIHPFFHETLSYKTLHKASAVQSSQEIFTLSASDLLGSTSCLLWQKQRLCKVIRKHTNYYVHSFNQRHTCCQVED